MAWLRFKRQEKKETEAILNSFERNEFEIVWTENQEAALTSDLIVNTLELEDSMDKIKREELIF